MAIKCKTAFVDPPVIMTMRIAFSKAPFVMMSRGFRSISKSRFMASPAFLHSLIFSSESAGELEEYGSVNPEQ